MCMYVCLLEFMCTMCMVHWLFLDLELQVILSCLLWMLGTNPRSTTQQEVLLIVSYLPSLRPSSLLLVDSVDFFHTDNSYIKETKEINKCFLL